MGETLPYRFAAAIVGGATAGAEVADKLANLGGLCVVFEQNDRPYGKVEDGLPLWHVALRRKEYDLINGKLSRPGVVFVPRTRVGHDIAFAELVEKWGFDVIVLAHGAWRDRPLPLERADAFVDRGLIYQNPLIYWFNHHRQPGYDGPQFELCDGTVVVGGGLASLDVVKVLQLEMTLKALAKRRIEQDLVEMETAGINETLSKHGLRWEDLELAGCTLFYRRRIEDMPLAEAPERATAEQQKKVETVRRRILAKAQGKYLFRVEAQWAPVGLLTDGDRLVGLRFAPTRIDDRGKAMVVPGEERDVRTGLVVSSIGSIPEPIEGLDMDGELLRLSAEGRVVRYSNVFGTGNAVTGKGNLVASRKHGNQMSAIIARHLGLGADSSNGSGGGRETGVDARDGERFPAGANGEMVESLLRRVRERQRAVGFTGDYFAWIKQVTPPGFA